MTYQIYKNHNRSGIDKNKKFAIIHCKSGLNKLKKYLKYSKKNLILFIDPSVLPSNNKNNYSTYIF